MVKLKVCVCSDMTLDESFNSTSPSQTPALAFVASVALKAYVTTPFALSAKLIVPSINRVPSGFQTFHLPEIYVTVFYRFLAVPLESLIVI